MAPQTFRPIAINTRRLGFHAHFLLQSLQEKPSKRKKRTKKMKLILKTIIPTYYIVHTEKLIRWNTP